MSNDIKNVNVFGNSEDNYTKQDTQVEKAGYGGDTEDVPHEKIKLMNDVLFKILFGTNKYVSNLERFLSDLLKYTVKVTALKNTEQTNSFVDEKQHG